MRLTEFFRNGIIPGAVAGLIGGLVFGATMSELGLLETTAGMARNDSSVVGFVILLVGASVIGSGFGLMVWHLQPGAGETLFWGLAYGAFWWYLGRLTLQPLIQGDGLAWSVEAAQAFFPQLIGLLLYGAITGLVLVAIKWKRYIEADPLRITRGVLIRGALSGLIGTFLLGVMLRAQGQLVSLSEAFNSGGIPVPWLITVIVGMVAGIGFALLYPRPTDSAGPRIIRGTVYGFLWWIIGALTLVPLLSGNGLAWQLDTVRSIFATFPAYLLFGASVAMIYQWSSMLVRLLFTDIVMSSDDEGVGARGLRILGRSLLSGIVGGLLFSLIMLQTGFLPYVAKLIGMDSVLAGFFVHLGIAQVIGTSYGLLFNRRSYDIGSALGWGVSYGFFWWILGPLTLMPLFLGRTPVWSVDVAAGAFPNLVGHLAYGAGLAITFYLLERRYSPWWIPRTQVQAKIIEERRQQVLSSAPALWTLTAIIGLTLPILLAS